MLSLASIGGPLLFGTVYDLVRQSWPGALWLSVIFLYALIAAIVMRLDASPGPR